jgi:hypothetical protein
MRRAGYGKIGRRDEGEKADTLRGFNIGKVGVGLNAEYRPTVLIVKFDLAAADEPRRAD